ncbi:cysteine desulfurase [Clostridia bacterium]|nr:cysteine desulfurase [Clostridia bacterium]
MIYFDSAATTMQKPPEVFQAVRRAERFGGAGRGGHEAAMNAAAAIYDCRELACKLFGASSPERVILTSNATHALNIAIKSLVNPQKAVITSGYEHNAVMRPIHALGVRHIIADDFGSALETTDAGLVVCSHVSNVFGTVLPVSHIAELCKRRGVPLIIDASQSAGVLPLDAEALQAVLCMPGHKGLYGPQGTGLLIAPSNIDLCSLIEGGTGSASLSYDMPKNLPDLLEAGTQNAWGAAGLSEGLKFVTRQTPQGIMEHEQKLLSEALKTEIDGVNLFKSENQAGVLSMTFRNHDAEAIAATLSDHGIAVRAGLQCAPLAHKTMGTAPLGTLRASFSIFNTTNEVRTFQKTLKAIVT